jgi:hypothetical protein
VPGDIGMGDTDVMRLEDMRHEIFACPPDGLDAFHAVINSMDM